MTLNPEDILKILLAVVAGELIGVDREFRDKAAGFRTLIFFCVGACLFTILSANFAPASDPNRIAANIVTGVDFLGAGVILRNGAKIIGLTTEATIWLTAAVGMAIGGGEYLISLVVVLAALIILWLLPAVKHSIDNAREERKYEVVCTADIGKFESLESTFREYGLRIQNHSQVKTGQQMVCSWTASGAPARHEEKVRRFFKNTEISELKW